MNDNLTLDQLAPRIDEARRAGFSDDEIIKELTPVIPTINDALKQGFNAKQILDELSPRRYVTAGEVATGAGQNFPSSMGNLSQSMYAAGTNPLATAKSVLDVGAGALQNVLPERFVQMVGEDPASREAARQMGKFFADRYGTGEKLRQTIATDPAGVLADLSTVISGGAMAAPKAVAPTLSRAVGGLQVRSWGLLPELDASQLPKHLGLDVKAGKPLIFSAKTFANKPTFRPLWARHAMLCKTSATHAKPNTALEWSTSPKTSPF